MASFNKSKGLYVILERSTEVENSVLEIEMIFPYKNMCENRGSDTYGN